jgi:hypothetical protein
LEASLGGEVIVTTVQIEVGVPDLGEIERIVDAWFDAAPLSTSYAVFEGDGPQDGHDLSTGEQRRVMMTAVRYLWLAAARKRVQRLETDDLLPLGS